MAYQKHTKPALLQKLSILFGLLPSLSGAIVILLGGRRQSGFKVQVINTKLLDWIAMIYGNLPRYTWQAIVNRPGVAGAVLQSPPSLIN